MGNERLRLNSDVFVCQNDKGPIMLTEDHGDDVMSFVSKETDELMLDYHVIIYHSNKKIQVRHETFLSIHFYKPRNPGRMGLNLR